MSKFITRKLTITYSEYMLESLITSKTRIKLLLKFFLNPENRTYLRDLAEELGESTNGIRVELDRFTKAGLLEKSDNGRTKQYRANKLHPLFPEINSLVTKYTGIDRLVNNVLSKLGNLEAAYVVGDYAHGIDSGIIDLVVVGNIDKTYFNGLVEKAEDIIKRKIRVLVLSSGEVETLNGKLELSESIPVWISK